MLVLNVHRSKYGVCLESLWPYQPNKFAVAPPQTCYTAASQHKVLKANSVPTTLAAMKAVLNAGFPFVIGIAVYSSFESNDVARTGMVPVPNTKTEQLLGGHAVLCCGYDDAKQCFIMRNSWGQGWGIKGYFYIPYVYLTNPSLSSDAWTITSVA